MEEDAEVQGHLTCSVCMEFYDDPRVLPCQHTFCSQCLQQIVNIDGAYCLRCPECRSPAGLPAAGVMGLHRNHKLSSLVECLKIHHSAEGDPSSVGSVLTIPTMLAAIVALAAFSIPMQTNILGVAVVLKYILGGALNFVGLCVWIAFTLIFFSLWCLAEAVWNLLGSVLLFAMALFYFAVAVVCVLVCALLLPAFLVSVKEMYSSEAVRARWKMLRSVLTEKNNE